MVIKLYGTNSSTVIQHVEEKVAVELVLAAMVIGAGWFSYRRH